MRKTVVSKKKLFIQARPLVRGCLSYVVMGKSCRELLRNSLWQLGVPWHEAEALLGIGARGPWETNIRHEIEFVSYNTFYSFLEIKQLK